MDTAARDYVLASTKQLLSWMSREDQLELISFLEAEVHRKAEFDSVCQIEDLTPIGISD